MIPLNPYIIGAAFAASLLLSGGAYWKGRSDGFNACSVGILEANDAAARAAHEARSARERAFDLGESDDAYRRD
jgi:hypothetical protein